MKVLSRPLQATVTLKSCIFSASYLKDFKGPACLNNAVKSSSVAPKPTLPTARQYQVEGGLLYRHFTCKHLLWDLLKILAEGGLTVVAITPCSCSPIP